MKAEKSFSDKKEWQGSTFVAHAFGAIDGYSYTNCLEAFEENYGKGHRVFEVDLFLTKDKKVVCAHDWNHGAKIQHQRNWSNETPPTEDEFKASYIYNKYTPLSLTDIFRLMNQYQDIWIVTDSKYSDEENVRIQFSYMVELAERLGMRKVLNRLIIQIYNEKMHEVVSGIYPFSSYIFTLYQRWRGDIDEFEKICEWCVKSNVRNITMWKGWLTDEILQISNHNIIDLYIHTENDVLEAKKALKRGIRGIYTDYLIPKDITYYQYYKTKIERIKKDRFYQKVIKQIAHQKEMKSCANWLRRGIAHGKKVVIFGAGRHGHQIYDILRYQKIEVAFLCDNNKGGSIDKETGLKVLKTDELKNHTEDFLILIGVADKKITQSIENQLINIGFYSEQISNTLDYVKKMTIENLDLYHDNFKWYFWAGSIILIGIGIFPVIYWNSAILIFAELYIMLLLIHSAVWQRKLFGPMDFRMVLYQLFSPLKGTGKEIKRSYISCVFKASVEIILLGGVYLFLKHEAGIVFISLLLLMVLFLIYHQACQMGIPEYFRCILGKTKLYENEYVEPESVKIDFPEKKKI